MPVWILGALAIMVTARWQDIAPHTSFVADDRLSQWPCWRVAPWPSRLSQSAPARSRARPTRGTWTPKRRRHLRRIGPGASSCSEMKTATFPSLRVEPELREAAESVLQEGETLSSFIETSVRETIERRRTRAEFIARGLLSRDEAKRTGVFFAPMRDPSPRPRSEVAAERRVVARRAGKWSRACYSVVRN